LIDGLKVGEMYWYHRAR